ncbi:MAG: EAL domain-containing protein [Oscillospiraceae bacterium]|nr:EAL domain-containing protein [Oscillospiraceae bacterium]
MLHDKPLFALCVSQIQNSEIRESVQSFVKEGRRRGYDILVFNSGLDAVYGNSTDQSCYSVYDLIPFDIVDLIVIMRDSIRNDAVCNTIAALAKERRVPVMCYDSEAEGIPSVFSYPYQAFPELLDHVIGHHKCRKVDLITGVRGNYGSECMVVAYREALRRAGIPFSPERVAYGDYWEDPAVEATRLLLAMDTPDAIVCANDSMAIACCGVLRQQGLRVPEDVIVTGLDGIVMERCFSPRLTTGLRDFDRMSTAALDTAEMILQGEDVAERCEIPPIFRISESCGCCATEQRDQNAAIMTLSRRLSIAAAQEADEHRIMSELMGRKQVSVIDYLDVLVTHIPNDSVLCLRDSLSADLSTASLEQFADPSELISTASFSRREKRFAIIPRSQLIPNLETVLAAGRPVYITGVYLQNEVYGYYAYYGDELDEECFRLPKRIHTAGHVIGSNLIAARLFKMNERLLASRIRDPLTGMLNLHGAMRAINERMNAGDHPQRLVMMVIGLRKLRQINSIFGHSEGDQALLSLANAISDCIDSDITAARIGGDEFLLAFFTSELRTDTADALVDVLRKRLQSYNQVSGKSYSIEIAVGQVSAPVTAGISTEGLLNEAIAQKDAERTDFSEAIAVQRADPAEMDRIISENLLTYHFQPIVSTKTGHIFAYEALMRARGDSSIPPLALLHYATDAGRLYEVEWLTYYNVLEHMRAHEAEFGGKRIFINSIPGHFISDTDFEKLRECYGELLPRLVVEFTEQAETEGEELMQIQARCAANQMDIAVDDYGTGYSNITNLLRYSPNYVKIDRSLISSIHEDPKKQHFVTNIIEFAHANGFMALAEGVETMDELRAVIRFGADLVQGNFTAKPSAVPITAIDETLSQLIVKLSAAAAKQLVRKTYMPGGEKTVSLVDLDRENYTDVFVAQGETELLGEFNTSTGVLIKIKDGTTCRLLLRDVFINSANQQPVIQIGRNCDVTLEFEGDNRMDNGGILVPESSRLHLTGRGNLSISTNQSKSFAIGNDSDFSCGDIVIDLAGILSVNANGDQAIGIGAGTGKNQLISVTGTRLFMQMSALEGIAVGTLEGTARLEFAGCPADFELSLANGAGVGAYIGRPEIRCSTADFNFRGSGKALTCVGSLNGGCSSVLTESGISADLTGQKLVVVGSGDCAPDITLRACSLSVHCEGNRAVDIGSLERDASVMLIDTDLNVYLRSAGAIHLGANQNHCIRSGGSELLDINQ